MKTSYEEIVNVDNIATLNGMGDLGKVIKLAKSEKRNPAENDIEKNLLVGIDFQVCFMEQIGSLQVPHSKKDVENFTRFIYKNINKITTIMCSLDFHKYESIFFPCWWHDAEGNEAEPGTVVTYDAVKNGLWIPKYDKRIPDENNPTKLVSYCEEYIRFLEQECNESYHLGLSCFGRNL